MENVSNGPTWIAVTEILPRIVPLTCASRNGSQIYQRYGKSFAVNNSAICTSVLCVLKFSAPISGCVCWKNSCFSKTRIWHSVLFLFLFFLKYMLPYRLGSSAQLLCRLLFSGPRLQYKPTRRLKILCNRQLECMSCENHSDFKLTSAWFYELHFVYWLDCLYVGKCYLHCICICTCACDLYLLCAFVAVILFHVHM